MISAVLQQWLRACSEVLVEDALCLDAVLGAHHSLSISVHQLATSLPVPHQEFLQRMIADVDARVR